MSKPKYTLSGKNFPCPICDRTKDGDCRFNSEIVLCHTNIDGGDFQNYTYRGMTDDGMWGQFFPMQETKPTRPKSKIEYFYPDSQGDNLVRVTRSDDGEGNKRFYQSHWDGQKWVNGVPDEFKSQVTLYRINDPINQQAIANGQAILTLEGEACVDAALALGIPATTSLGGSGKWRKYGHKNYLKALEGAVVVICPDRDEAGIKHAQAIAQDFPNAQWLYAKPESSFWENLPKNGGLDIADWVDDLQADGLNDSEIRDRICGAIESKPRAIASSQPTEGAVQPISEEIDAHLTQTFNDIPLADIFPAELAKPVKDLTDRLNIPQAVAAFILITSTASLVKLMSRVTLPGGTGHKEPPIIWTNLLAESGEGKSPLIAALTTGLKQLHSEAYAKWKNDKAAYESESKELEEKLKDLKAQAKKLKGDEAKKLEEQIEACKESLEALSPPIARRLFYISSLTTEALVMRQADQPGNGFLVLVDELAGFFLSMGKYQQKSDDREAWLTFYDGGGLEQVRATRDDVFLEAFSASVLGGMQPCKLKQLTGSLEDQDGLWARFIQISMPSRRMPQIDFNAPGLDLSIVDQVYRAVDSQPATEYALHLTAFSVWKEWHEWIEDQRLDEGHPAIRVLYPKAKGRAARIALVLHCIDIALGGQNGPISVETLQKAIRLTKWQLEQTKDILDELGLADNPAADRVARFITKFRDAGWIKARTVQRWWTGDKLKADQARHFMCSIVALGYAESNGEDPIDPKYQINIISQNLGDKVTTSLNYLQNKGADLSPTHADSEVTKVTKTGDSDELEKLSPAVTYLSPAQVTTQNHCSEGDTEFLSPCHLDPGKKENENLIPGDDGSDDWEDIV